MAHNAHGEDLKCVNYFSIKSRKIKFERLKYWLENVRIDTKKVA
jgi:hypothetical protein